MPRHNKQIQVYQLGETGGAVTPGAWPFEPAIESGYELRLTADVARGGTLLPVDVFAIGAHEAVRPGSVGLSLNADTRVAFENEIYQLADGVDWRLNVSDAAPTVVYDPADLLQLGSEPFSLLTPNGTRILVSYERFGHSPPVTAVDFDTLDTARAWVSPGSDQLQESARFIYDPDNHGGWYPFGDIDPAFPDDIFTSDDHYFGDFWTNADDFLNYDYHIQIAALRNYSDGKVKLRMRPWGDWSDTDNRRIVRIHMLPGHPAFASGENLRFLRRIGRRDFDGLPVVWRIQ